MQKIIEIRSYTLKPGSARQFHQIMQQHSLPLLAAAGMEVVASGHCLLAPDAYVLIRAYADTAQLQQSQDDFYGSAAWLQGPRAAVLACIHSYHSVVLAADATLIQHLRRHGAASIPAEHQGQHAN